MSAPDGPAVEKWRSELNPLTLDGNNALLSPDICPKFDPDAFLLSRRLAAVPSADLGDAKPADFTQLAGRSEAGNKNESPGAGTGPQLIVHQDLFAILAELREHSTNLSDKLAEAINRDYRQFVGLASEVRQEVPRIERLAHNDETATKPVSVISELRISEPPPAQPTQGVDGVLSAVANTRQSLAGLNDDLVHLASERSCAQRSDEFFAKLVSLDTDINELLALLQPAASANGDYGATPSLTTWVETLRGQELYSNEEEDTDTLGTSDSDSSLSLDDTKAIPPVAPKDRQPGSMVVHPAVLVDVSHRRAELCSTLQMLRMCTQPPGEEPASSVSEQGPKTGADDAIEPSLRPLADAFVSTLMEKVGVCESRLLDAAERVLSMLLSRDSTSGSLLFPRLSHKPDEATHLGRLRASAPQDPNLSPQDEQRLWFTHCLSILAQSATSEAVEKTQRRAEIILQSLLVEPLLDPLLSQQSLSSLSISQLLAKVHAEGEGIDNLSQVQAQGCSLADLIASKRSSPDPNQPALINCFNAVLSISSTDLTPFVELCSRSGAQIDLLRQVIWPHVLNLLQRKLEHLFLVGHPDTFHTNYLLTQAFLSRLVLMLQPPAVPPNWAQTIWQDPSYLHFSRHWPIVVYWQLRMRSIVAQMEPDLAAEAGMACVAPAARRADGFLLHSTAAASEAVHAIWDARVALDDLLARQWKSTLHLLSRFSHWLEDTIDAHDLAPTSVPDLSEMTNGLGGGVSRRGTPTPDAAGRSSTPASRFGTPNPLTQAESVSAMQAQQDLRALRAMRLAADLVLLRDKLIELFDNAIAPSIQRVGGEVDESGTQTMTQELRSTLLSVLSFAQPTSIPMQLITSAVVPVLKHKVNEPLKQPRHIATQYRATLAAAGMQSTSKVSAEIQPSPFLSQFTLPISDLFTQSSSEEAAIALPVQLKRALLQRVGQSSFTGLSTALSGVKETQASLRRLKKSNEALGLGFAAALFSGSSSGPSSSAPEADEDSVRMRAQMETDLSTLQEATRKVYSLAGAGEPDWEDPAWRKLVRVVTSEQPTPEPKQ